MASTYHINPRIRAYGKARIDITQRAENEEEWLDGWRESLHPFAFEFKGHWKFNIEYKVDDYAAEVGFFIDILGFPVVEFSPSHAQFTTPDQEFTFSVAAALEGEGSTNPETLRLQFMVDEIMETCKELELRGAKFEQPPQKLPDGSGLFVGYFRTPHGVPIDLWGFHQEVVQEDFFEDGEDEKFTNNLDDKDIWKGDEEKKKQSPPVDSIPEKETPPEEEHSEDIFDDQGEDTLELVYEDDDDPDLIEKLINSFDRFRPSQPLSRFSLSNKRTNKLDISSSSRLYDQSGYNQQGKTGSPPNFLGDH